MKRIALLVLVGGTVVAASIVALQELGERKARAKACDALRAAAESGAAFTRTVVGDDIDFTSNQAASFEGDLDAAYEAAGRSGDRDLFGEVIHARGEFLRAKKVFVHASGAPGFQMTTVVQWALSSERLVNQTRTRCVSE